MSSDKKPVPDEEKPVTEEKPESEISSRQPCPRNNQTDKKAK